MAGVIEMGKHVPVYAMKA